MVLFTNPSNEDKDSRRLSMLVRKASWRLSWRSSKKKLIDSEEESRKEKERSRPRKEVMFWDENTEFPPEEEFITEEEFQSRWYQKTDYARFEKDRVLTSMDYLSSVRRGTNFNSDEHSVRGLEPLLDNKLARRSLGERKDLVKALKAEEERQKQEGVFPCLVDFRAVAAKHSKPARERAFATAQEDARVCRPKTTNQLGVMVELLARFGRKNNLTQNNNSASGPSGTGTRRRRSIA